MNREKSRQIVVKSRNELYQPKKRINETEKDREYANGTWKEKKKKLKQEKVTH